MKLTRAQAMKIVDALPAAYRRIVWEIDIHAFALFHPRVFLHAQRKARKAKGTTKSYTESSSKTTT